MCPHSGIWLIWELAGASLKTKFSYGDGDEYGTTLGDIFGNGYFCSYQTLDGYATGDGNSEYLEDGVDHEHGAGDPYIYPL